MCHDYIDLQQHVGIHLKSHFRFGKTSPDFTRSSLVLQLHQARDKDCKLLRCPRAPDTS